MIRKAVERPAGRSMLIRYVPMAELEPGHPDELLERLTNWLNQANYPIGSLPPDVTPTEWAVRNFIDTCGRRSARA